MITSQTVLLAVRNGSVDGQFTGNQGTRLWIAWQAIQNREAAQIAYEQHLRELAVDALNSIGYPTLHYDLDSIAADILDALDLTPVRAIADSP